MTGDDAQWRSALRSGTADGFDDLVAAYTPRLWRHLVGLGYAAADADDLVQETFLRAWQHRHRYDGNWAVSTWLFTIARNLGASLRRRRQPVRAIADHDPPVVEPAPHHPAVDGLWDRARRLLDDRTYQALWLRYGDDLPHEDIAAILGITAGHVRVLIHRARGQLAMDIARSEDSHATI
ncbi:DNA-directed RNA polymerase sigma-70 factor [Planctomycetota bacterium]|nr:DNA-directed RNA polymerase sigma-70 factor [Planctomycetota bacterium]